jgi:hypothetical protein
MREQGFRATDHKLYCENQLEKLTQFLLSFLKKPPNVAARVHILNSRTLLEKVLLFETRV